MFKIELFVNFLAEKCKMIYEKLSVEKAKPIPEVPKVKPPPTRDRRLVKSIKSKEEPPVKPQTEEKSVPAKVDNYKNYNYNYVTPIPTTSDLPPEQTYSSGYTNLNQNVTSSYNGTYPYAYR